MSQRSHSAEHAHAVTSSRLHVADLLARYPNISERESAQILSFLRTGRHLDIGLLTSNTQLRPQLDSFMAEHRKELSLGFSEIAILVSGITALLAACWLVWSTFGPAAV